VFLLNGPNLNLLGRRDPELYGSVTLEEIERRVRELLGEAGVEATCLQSNSEGDLVDAIQRCLLEGVDGLIINPGAYTHTSVAIRDALAMLRIPVIEVHLSKPSVREPFRRVSLITEHVWGRIEGFGALGYELACRALLAAEGFRDG
jgi:3-dehydroquinate dehydratase-2